MLDIAAQVVLQAEKPVPAGSHLRPADAILRDTLRQHSLSPTEKAEVVHAVFSYFRWWGWLPKKAELPVKIKAAASLAARFKTDAVSFTDSELLGKALPLWVQQFVKITPDLLREFQREPTLWIRSRFQFQEQVEKSLPNLEPHPSIPNAFAYRGAEDLFKSEPFQLGWFEIQDLSSQIVSLLCAPDPGQGWWDACAGEGGKTLHLSDLMKNQGVIWATDRALWRLNRLKARARKAGVFNYRAKLWPNSAKSPVKGTFHGVLVDAPCSGIGTWGRNPHARWTTTPADVKELAVIQKRLLDEVALTIRPGGKLIYSVCTLTTLETEKVADHFQSNHPEFEPLPLQIPAASGLPAPRIWLRPEELHANGMFVAAWRKR